MATAIVLTAGPRAIQIVRSGPRVPRKYCPPQARPCAAALADDASSVPPTRPCGTTKRPAARRRSANPPGESARERRPETHPQHRPRSAGRGGRHPRPAARAVAPTPRTPLHPASGGSAPAARHRHPSEPKPATARRAVSYPKTVASRPCACKEMSNAVFGMENQRGHHLIIHHTQFSIPNYLMNPMRPKGKKMNWAWPSIRRSGTRPHFRLSELWPLLSPRQRKWPGCT